MFCILYSVSCILYNLLCILHNTYNLQSTHWGSSTLDKITCQLYNTICKSHRMETRLQELLLAEFPRGARQVQPQLPVCAQLWQPIIRNTSTRQRPALAPGTMHRMLSSQQQRGDIDGHGTPIIAPA